MTDLPIIFSGSMIRALLEGRKTMTRRLAWRGTKPTTAFPEGTMRSTTWQNVKPGDRLWVKENWSAEHYWQGTRPSCMSTYILPETWYWADGNPSHGDWTKPISPLFMPRRRSRLSLIVTATKVEPLQDISEEEAQAEGAPRAIAGNSDAGIITTHRTGFVGLWRELHGPGAWMENPDVVALTFKVVRANIDAAEARAA